MSYVKIEDNIVTEKRPTQKEGFIEAPDYVVSGYLYDGETFSPPDPLPPSEYEDVIMDFTYLVKNEGDNISSGQFYHVGKFHNWELPSGSWSGWSNNIAPLIIPYNCKITNAIINFKEANFDWRDSPGNIYLDVGFIDHGYNTTFNERMLIFELDGDFEEV